VQKNEVKLIEMKLDLFLPAQSGQQKIYKFTHKRSPARISLVKGERYSRYAEEPELSKMAKLSP